MPRDCTLGEHDPVDWSTIDTGDPLLLFRHGTSIRYQVCRRCMSIFMPQSEIDRLEMDLPKET